MNQVLFSICIPAYRRPENMKRLLESIAIQTFKEYEIVITDDSPDDSVKEIMPYYSALPIRYYKNEKALGTPANWNYAISLAKGEWIKLMHDDDWFADKNSLAFFAKETQKGSLFIFSHYTDIFGSGKTARSVFPVLWKRRIVSNPVTLMARNVIGPPSVTMVHHSIKEQYDTWMKWRVDIDFYIRVLKKEKSYSIIKKPLINVGISASQVTNACFNIPAVELPESLLLLKKYGLQPLQNLVVYDAWWRIWRNLEIRSKEQLAQYISLDEWPQALIRMLKHESLIPLKWLRIGIFSKFFMFLSYLANKKFLKN